MLLITFFENETENGAVNETEGVNVNNIVVRYLISLITFPFSFILLIFLCTALFFYSKKINENLYEFSDWGVDEFTILYDFAAKSLHSVWNCFSLQ